MKKILLILTALVLSQMAMAQQFSLPIMPEKMWPSDYAKYETDVLNCCSTNPSTRSASRFSSAGSPAVHR